MEIANLWPCSKFEMCADSISTTYIYSAIYMKGHLYIDDLLGFRLPTPMAQPENSHNTHLNMISHLHGASFKIVFAIKNLLKCQVGIVCRS